MWNKYKQPGEKSHSELRWSIREQMLEKVLNYFFFFLNYLIHYKKNKS